MLKKHPTDKISYEKNLVKLFYISTQLAEKIDRNNNKSITQNMMTNGRHLRVFKCINDKMVKRQYAIHVSSSSSSNMTDDLESDIIEQATVKINKPEFREENLTNNNELDNFDDVKV